MKKILILFVFVVFSSNSLFADSPLTSTDFYKAYANIPIIKIAGGTKGLLTKGLIEYIDDNNNPIDIKIAIINRLGWNIKGKSNGLKFIEYYKKKYNLNNALDVTNKMNATELICLAYLKALDNYFKVTEANAIALHAIKLNPNSYTIRIIQSLINSQSYVMSNYCKVFNTIEEVKLNQNLTIDFKEEASLIIYEYINGYKKYCRT